MQLRNDSKINLNADYEIFRYTSLRSLTLALILFLSCYSPSIKAQQKSKNELKVLTWNVYSLPFFINNTKRVKRAEGIVKVLKESNYDVIVLQETFHKKSFRIIEEGLKHSFPHHIKVNRKGGVFKTHHGIFIASKLPATILGTIAFKNCKGGDCISKKGAVLIEIEKEGKSFQILGTHLQSGKQDEREAIRKIQRQEITSFINQHKKEGVPQLLCGDFNTDYNNVNRRKNLLNDLELSEVDVPKEKTWPSKYYKTKKIHNLIFDYIFIKPNGFANYSNNLKVIDFYDEKQKLWISDHSAVEMILTW